jgi:O-antigen ligase
MFRSSWFFGLLILLAVPVLLFSSGLPAWAPMLALGWLVLLFVLHGVVTGHWLSTTPADIVLLALMLLLPLGLWASSDMDVTLARTFALLANIALFYAIAIQAEIRGMRWIGWALLAAGIILVFATVPMTKFWGAKLPFLGRSVYDLLPSGMRLPGDENGFNPNMTGGLLAVFVPPALVLSIRAESRWQRVLAIVALLLTSVAVLLTQSRGALIGLIVGFAVVTGILWRKLGLVWLAGGVLAVVALALKGGAIMQALFSNNAQDTEIVSMTARVELWNRAIYAGTDFPLTGIGMGQFPDTVQRLYPPSHMVLSEAVPHAHNFFLQIFAEMGYPGLIVYVAFFLILFFVLLRRIHLARDWRQVLSIGLLGSLTVFLTHGIVDVPSYSPLSAIVFWGLFGVMMAVGLSGDRAGLPEEVASD